MRWTMESCIGADHTASGIGKHLCATWSICSWVAKQAGSTQHSLPTPTCFGSCILRSATIHSVMPLSLLYPVSSSPAQFLLSTLHTITIPMPPLAIKANNDIRVVPTKPSNSHRNANTTHRPTPNSTTPQPSPESSQTAASGPPRPPQPAKSRIKR